MLYSLKLCNITSFFFLDLPALFMAIATACFSGFPSLRSVAMLLETVFLDLPFFSGTSIPPFVPCSFHTRVIFIHCPAAGTLDAFYAPTSPKSFKMPVSSGDIHPTLVTAARIHVPCHYSTSFLLYLPSGIFSTRPAASNCRICREMVDRFLPVLLHRSL